MSKSISTEKLSSTIAQVRTPSRIEGNACHNLCIDLLEDIGNQKAAIFTLIDKLHDLVASIGNQQSFIAKKCEARDGIDAGVALRMYEDQKALNEEWRWAMCEACQSITYIRSKGKLVRKRTLFGGRLVSTIQGAASVKAD